MLLQGVEVGVDEGCGTKGVDVSQQHLANDGTASDRGSQTCPQAYTHMYTHRYLSHKAELKCSFLGCFFFLRLCVYAVCMCVCMFTRAYDACVEYREVLLAGGEGSDGEGATGLGAAAHPPLCWRTGTLCSWTPK